jgi:hypothetical protein
MVTLLFLPGPFLSLTLFLTCQNESIVGQVARYPDCLGSVYPGRTADSGVGGGVHYSSGNCDYEKA